MYEENKFSINWFKIGLRLIIVLLTVLLLFIIVSIIKDNKTNVIEKDEMKEKINLLEDVGKKYFTNDKFPKEVGDSVTITLGELIDAKLIEEIKDAKEKSCNLEKSYIKVTHLDEEYQMKTYLTCDTFEDFKNSFISIAESNSQKVTIEKNEEKLTTKVTTKKPTTTTKAIKTYQIAFNTNGGSIIDTINVQENGLITSLKTPERFGYTFIGWYYHGELFDLNTKINQDYILVAKWIKE